MKLKELLNQIYSEDIPAEVAQWNIKEIHCDSRQVTQGSMFIAVKGPSGDGSRFISQAIEKGARVIVLEKNSHKHCIHKDIFLLEVDDSLVFLRQAVSRLYNSKNCSVKVIGITGTNGKTTITYLLESIFAQAGFKSGVIGTINHRIGEMEWLANNTTPGIIDNQKMLSTMCEQHVDYCCMEVSSHALDQGRVALIDFQQAVYTNLTGDHLDYHKTMDNYFQAKSLLFATLDEEKFSVINCDDEYGQKLIEMMPGPITTYGIYHPSDIMAVDIYLHLDGTDFRLLTPGGEVTIQTKLLGEHNVYNILSAAAVCFNEGISLEDVKRGIEVLSDIPGRLEAVEAGQEFKIFIDYAHTHDALENVLKAIRKVTDQKIILVFGCGGDRDKTKRPLMGKIAGQYADYSIVTSDNPRTEDPQTIINDILLGFESDNFEVIVLREEAIVRALKMANPNDIILIAGKGHERYQIFKDHTIIFDERTIIKDCLC